MKLPFRFHFICMIAVSILLFASILLSFGCCKNPADDDEPDTVTDIDGNEYVIVKIGNQVWMEENLRVTHYRNGDAIPNVTDNAAWLALSTGACCVYENTAGNSATYGLLYNFYAVADARNIAPEGWHVPTDAEWKQLEMYLGMSQEDADLDGSRGTDEGGKLKESGTSHWDAPNTGATNSSGFSALPGGLRTGSGPFYHLGGYTVFWTATEDATYIAWARELSYDAGDIYRYLPNKRNGYSVRCVKD